MRLKRSERGAINKRRLHAERLELLGLGMRRVLPAGAPIGLDPATGPQKSRRARVLREFEVLRRSGEQERGHDLAGRRFSRWRRGLEIAPDRGRDRWQRAMAHMGARIAVDGRAG